MVEKIDNPNQRLVGKASENPEELARMSVPFNKDVSKFEASVQSEARKILARQQQNNEK